MRKMITACGLLFVMVAAVVVAGAATLPNYAGTWVLNKDKSKLPPQMQNAESMDLIVTQDAQNLTVKSSMGGGQETTYKLDGSKSKAQRGGRFPGEATVYLEKKDDGKIVLHSDRELNMQGNTFTIKSTEKWELTDGGKTLNVNLKVESPRGEQEMTLVFNLKS